MLQRGLRSAGVTLLAMAVLGVVLGFMLVPAYRQTRHTMQEVARTEGIRIHPHQFGQDVVRVDTPMMKKTRERHQEVKSAMLVRFTLAGFGLAGGAGLLLIARLAFAPAVTREDQTPSSTDGPSL